MATMQTSKSKNGRLTKEFGIEQMDRWDASKPL